MFWFLSHIHIYISNLALLAFFSQTKRTLRVFISNLASDQPSQLQSDADEDNVDLGTGGAPSWTLRIEGRLLDVSIWRVKDGLSCANLLIEGFVMT